MSDKEYSFFGNTDLPLVSFVIPVFPDSGLPVAVASINQVQYPKEKIEIIVVEGRNPSLQRNEGVRQAAGEFVYFLDNDSEISPKSIRYALEYFLESDDPQLVCIGGPVLTKHTDTPFKKAVGASKGSVFGMGPSRHRHVPYGLVREASEKELISANMIVRRSAVCDNNGFDETIYPNEENELLKRLKFKGMRCLYHPLMAVFRSRRKNLSEVFTQNFRYGSGRMRHFFRQVRLVDFVLLAPVVLLACIIAPICFPNVYVAMPIMFYLVINIIASMFIALLVQYKIRSFFYLLLIFPVMHLSYGLGLLWGGTKLILGIKHKVSKTEILVRRAKEFSQRAVTSTKIKSLKQMDKDEGDN
jgi:cellulose synthase/poly-beta-1,6-N-acetylglucosamine synthase-like glycosyltransferase